MTGSIINQRWHLVILISSFAALLLGIGSGSTTAGRHRDDDITPNVISVPPIIDVSPSSLSATQGPGKISIKTLTIVSSGGDPLTWIILEDDGPCGSAFNIPWLSIAPDNGTTPSGNSTSVDVTFDSTGLAYGDYTAYLCVTSNDPVTPLMQVPVSLKVAPPIIEVSPPSLSAEQGPDEITTQSLTINSSGGDPLTWSILEDDGPCGSPSDIPWLSVAPDNGTTPSGNSTSVGVTFDSTELPPDEYLANLCVDSNDPATPTVQVQVRLKVHHLPPGVVVTPESQKVQYSDEIMTLTITAKDSDVAPLEAVTSWSTDQAPFNPGLPDFLVLASSPDCIDSGGVQICTWTINGVMDLPEGVTIIRTAVSDKYGGMSIGDVEIIVMPENATVTFDGGNPTAVPVTAPGGNSEPFSLTVHISEHQPDQPAGLAGPGDISRAATSLHLMPAGPGSPVAGACSPGVVSGSGYGAILTVTCDFNHVPADTYAAPAIVAGGYFAGIGERALRVVDPGFNVFLPITLSAP